jgi:putative ABC transport system permease protein
MAWLQRFWNTLRPGRVEDDIRREIAFHLRERADELQSQGLSRADAERRARRQFGHSIVQAERTRDMDVFVVLDGVQRDVRYAVRSLRRAPGFTLTVLVTLALGIGSNSTVFSAVDAVLLRPLPFPDGDRLMQLQQRVDGTTESHIAPVRLEEWHAFNTTFTAISGYYTEDVSDTSGDFPVRLKRAVVAPRFFDVWRVAPVLGRGFTDAEHRVGGPRAVVISHRYWRDRLGSDPAALARTVRIGTRAVPIVGVLPASFLFPDREVDLWSPSIVDADYAQSRQATWHLGIGRLKPDVTVPQARANLAAVQARLAEQHGDPDKKIAVEMTPLKDVMVGGVGRSLWLLFGGASVLLLITCTNIAALLLSRMAHRHHELSIRMSLGASRLAVAMQILIEALVLCVAGGVAGYLLAWAGIALLRSAFIELPRAEEIAVDWRVALYTLASAVVVALACGALPALRAWRERPGAALQAGSRAVVSTRCSMQWLLVGAQVALSITLLAGAGLLLRSVQQLERVDSGFDLSNVLAFRVSANWAEGDEQEHLRQRIDETLETLRGLPAVQAAATTGWSLPGTPTQWETTFAVAEARSDDDRRLIAEGRSVSPEYFATMRIPLVAGELCRRETSGGAAAVKEAMVNRAFVARYLAGRSAIGLHLAIAESPARPSRIAGIVGDARESGLDREPPPTVYWCDTGANPMPYFLLRTSAPTATAQMLRVLIRQIDPARAVYDIGPLEERIDAAYAHNRVRTLLLALFAVTALTLACVGIYGTLSYAVSIRRREVGLRLALGALRRGVIAQFLGEGLRVVAIASVCGLAITLAGTRVIAGMLFGVSPTDPATLASVLFVVFTVAALAAVVPAVRAARLDAVTVLREE